MISCACGDFHLPVILADEKNPPPGGFIARKQQTKSKFITRNPPEGINKILIKYYFRFNFAVGSLYIRKYFNRKSKAAVHQAFEDIRTEFRTNLQDVSWMDNVTREAAIRKVDRMTSHIGYADELLDDKKLEEFYNVIDIHPDKFFSSILSINNFFTDKQFKMLREPVNKTSWYLYESPTTVNAFYDSNRNGIGN